jgi:tetratricopeptide (TPR) repeat protein
MALATAAALLAALVVAVGREQGRTRAALLAAEANYQDARKAVDDYLTSVGEETLLDEPGMQPLRMRLLRAALAYHREFVRRGGRDPRRKAELAQSHMRLARVAGQVGPAGDAVPGYEQALRLYQDIARANPTDPGLRAAMAECYGGLAGIQVLVGPSRKALENCDRAIALYEGLLRERPSEVAVRSGLAWALGIKADLHRAVGRYKEASPLYGRAIALQEGLVAERPGSVEFREALVLSYSRSGPVLSATGRPDLAMQNYWKADATYERLAREYPRSSKYRAHRGEVLEKMAFLHARSNHPAEAAREFGRAATIYAELLRENPGVATYQRELAHSYLRLAGEYLDKLNDPAKGRAALQKAFELYQQFDYYNERDISVIRSSCECSARLGRLWLDSGRIAEALGALRRASDGGEELARREPDDIFVRGDLGSYHSDLARVLNRLGRHAEAEAASRRALELYRSIFGADPGRGHGRQAIVNPSFRLVEALLGQGRPAEAAAILGELREVVRDDPLDMYDVACWLSRCVAPGGTGEAPSPPDRSSERHGYADRAMDALREAVRAGYRDVEHMSRDPDLDPLRSRADFRALMLDLAFPSDPIAQ